MGAREALAEEVRRQLKATGFVSPDRMPPMLAVRYWADEVRAWAETMDNVERPSRAYDYASDSRLESLANFRAAVRKVRNGFDRQVSIAERGSRSIHEAA